MRIFNLKLFFLVLFMPAIAMSKVALIEKAKEHNILLTEDDERILKIGHISKSRYVIGGIIGTYPIGFGVGHAIQNRWSDNGWIFTAGEVGSVILVAAGAMKCIDKISQSQGGCTGTDGGTLLTIGIVGFVGFRIWEILDVWIAPDSINRKHKLIEEKLEEKIKEKKAVKTSLDIRPILDPSGSVGAGLVFSF
jgi:proteasome assembly chaperone (PAC2) family protein